MISILLLLFITLSTSIHLSSTSNHPNTNHPDTNNSYSLSTWFSLLSIHLPTIKVPITNIGPIHIAGGVFILSNMICSNLSIASIDSTYKYPTNFSLGINNLQISCSGDWNVSSLTPGSAQKGGLSVIVDQTSIDLGLSLGTREFYYSGGGLNNGSAYNILLADYSNATLFNLEFNVPYIHFTGDPTENLVEVLNIVTPIDIAWAQTVLVQNLTTAYYDLVNKNLTSFLQSMQPFLESHRYPESVFPPVHSPPAPYGSVDLTTSPIVSALEYVSINVLQANMDSLLNDVEKDSNVHFDSTTYYEFDVFGLTTIWINLKSLDIKGLDSFSTVDLFKVYDNSTLLTSIILDYLDIDLYLSIKVGGGIFVGPTLNEEFNFKLNVTNLQIDISALIFMKNDILSSYQLNQLLNIDCMLGALSVLNMTSFFIYSDWHNFELHSINGGNLESGIDAIFNNLVSVAYSFKDGGYNSFIHYATEFGRNYLNNYIAGRIAKPTGTCPVSDVPTVFNTDSNSNMIILLSTLAFILSIAFYMICFYPKKDEYQSVGEAADQGDSQIIVSTDNDALIFNPNIHFAARFIIPAVLTINFALFISSNLSTGASVDASLTENGVDSGIVLPSLFTFNLSNSVHDMWNAGVYPLSILIAVLSGGWPYLKLALMFISWVFPSKILPVPWREWLLMILDAWGKWSLVDAFIMILMMVAFRLHIVQPHTSGEPYAAFDLIVDPMWGVQSFILATIMSLVTTHIVLSFHRFTSKKRMSMTHYEYEGQKHTLANHIFIHRDEKNNRLIKVHMHYVTQVFVAIILAVGLIMVCFGASLHTFQFEFKGLLGEVLTFVGESTVVEYSALTLGARFPYSSRYPDSFQIRWIQVCFYIFVFIVPVTHIIIMIVLWVTPLTFKMQRDFFFAVEVLNAWSAAEVFIIAIIASVLEVRQFSAFMVNNQCNTINAVLAQYFSAQLDNDPTCFDVNASLDGGAWIFFSAAIFLIISRNTVMNACHRALTEKELFTVNSGVNTSPFITRNKATQGENDIDIDSSQWHIYLFKFFSRFGLVDIEEVMDRLN